MMETFTLENDLLFNNHNNKNFMDGLCENDLDIYYSFSPALDNLLKVPSEKTIENILNFSRNL